MAQQAKTTPAPARAATDTAASRCRARLRRVADALLDIAAQHAPIAGPVRPRQRAASYAIDIVAEQIDEVEDA